MRGRGGRGGGSGLAAGWGRLRVFGNEGVLMAFQGPCIQFGVLDCMVGFDFRSLLQDVQFKICWITGLFIPCVCVETYAFIHYDHLGVSALVICFLALGKSSCIQYVLLLHLVDFKSSSYSQAERPLTK